MADTTTTAEIVVLEQAPTDVLLVTIAERGADGMTDHGALTGLGDDDHGHYHTDARGDARYTPIAHASDTANPHEVSAAQVGADAVGTAATLIAAHSIAADPHAPYALEADLGTAAYLDTGVLAGNVVVLGVGGALPAVSAAALLDLPGGVTNGDSHDHSGGDGAQIAYASLSGTPTLGTAAAAATGDFEPAGAVSTHNAVTTAHGISAFGATVIDDADAATARGTLGLGNVDNTSDANKPVSTAQQTALNLKANLASPTFTGTVGGITAAMVGAPSGSGTSTGTNTGDAATPAETTNSIGTLILGATSKTTPVDADQIGLVDSAAANVLKKLSWANIKAALSGLYVLLAGKAGGQTIVGDTASGGHLTLKATSHTTQGIVRIDNGARINSVATEEYVRARGMSLISNGSGLMYNNNNFSSYTFDSTDTASGGGSFRINGTYVAALSDELIPVDTLGARYVLSLLAKAGDVGGGNFNPANKQYFGVALYDADGISISSPMGAKFTGSTDTTLAVALNPGDTTITLTDATGWNSTGAAAGRNFAWYGYSNSFGYTYPNYTYTRNISNSYGSNNSLGAWASGGISGNVITLRVPWTGPALAAGAAVRNVGAAGSYKYIALAAGTVPNAWTPYSGFIGGIASDSSDGDTNFRHGTAFVKFLHLINYHAGGADTNIRLSTLKLSVVSSANLEDRIGVGATYKILPTVSLPANGLAVEGNSGFGTASPSAKIHAIAIAEQLRYGYDASNYLGSTTNSAGVTTFNLVGTAPAAKWAVSDATSNATYDVATFSKNSTGAGAAGLGSRIVLAAKSSTTVDTPQAGISSEWLNATHATRTSRLKLSANDYGGAREGIRIESDGAVPRLGFYGATAVVKPTAQIATVPAAPAGGTGTAAGGWDTSINRDLAIATINNLKTRVDQLETKLQALGLLT